MGNVDINLRNCISGERIVGEHIYGKDYSDAVKCSNVKDVFIKECVIIGGKEDVLDCNRYSENISLFQCMLVPTGLFVATIKGGSKNVSFVDCSIDGHGKEVDIDLGNWSDQSEEKATGVLISNCNTMDGSPIRVRVLNADKPVILNCNIEYAFPHPDAWYHDLCVRVFMFARKWLGLWAG